MQIARRAMRIVRMAAKTQGDSYTLAYATPIVITPAVITLTCTDASTSLDWIGMVRLTGGDIVVSTVGCFAE